METVNENQKLNMIDSKAFSDKIKETPEENMKKFYRYKFMFGNLNESIKAGYYLQAVFIEYAIIEDRASSIIAHTLGENKTKTNKGKPKNLADKIKMIKGYARDDKSDAWMKKYLSADLLDQIEDWKGRRNRCVHALMLRFDSQDELAQLAEEGRTIARAFSDIAGKVRKHSEKISQRKATKKK